MPFKLPSVSRRRFLSQAATAAAAVWFHPAQAQVSSGVIGANERIRVGLIGCGGMGRGDLATFLKYDDVECVVLCDVDDRMLAEAIRSVADHRPKQPDTVKDFRRIIDRSDVDAVIVATPDHWHALPTIYACQAAKDVYVEKPLATSIDEGRSMVIAADRYKRMVQMGTQRRSSPAYADAVDFVRSGKLGKIGLARAWAYLDWIKPIGNPPDASPPIEVDYDQWLGPAPKRPYNPNRFHFNFRWFWDYAGGLMTDWGVHLIQVLVWAMGHDAPTAVFSSGGKYVLDDNSETPDTQMTVYEFPTYTLVWEHRVGIGLGLYNRPWGMAFVGTEGTLVIDDSGWEILREPSKESLEGKKFAGDADPRPAHIRNFVDSVKTRRPPVEDLVEGHHVSTVAHLGNIALRSGERILWNAREERIMKHPDADRLVGKAYRKPWMLPYSRRS